MNRHTRIAMLALAAIIGHLLLKYVISGASEFVELPLYAALLFGGTPLVIELLIKLWRLEFGSDLLAGISIVTSVILGEYLAGSLVVLMLSGGEALEGYAVKNASFALEALAKRMPAVAHRKGDSILTDIPLDKIAVGDEIVVLPHEVCPIDGVVIEGHGVMDESYLTGEPYLMSKTPGSTVLSGAINGESALVIRAEKRAIDSRYAKIMQVMQESSQKRPHLRRLGDQLGAIYTPIALVIGVLAWVISGQAVRFLAVMVVATPCPLLIAIPVAIIGSISLAARRAIVIRDPIVLEKVDTCRTVIFDKTGTLTLGKPRLIEQVVARDFRATQVLSLVASLERYSKHPLASAIISASEAEGAMVHEATEISERPGQGLRGTVAGHTIRVTSRKQVGVENPGAVAELPEVAGGLECIILIDGRYAATYRFRDTPRSESASFIQHLSPKHKIDRVLLVSGDRESETSYLAKQVGISEVFYGQSPEDKVRIVREATATSNTLFVGDGINDAPALLAATIGVAFGSNSDVTVEAAGAVVLDSSLQKIDELMHIGRRMRTIALQSAVGGIALSVAGMILALFGWLPPVAGALTQEAIDVVVVLNALRVALPPKSLIDYDHPKSVP